MNQKLFHKLTFLCALVFLSSCVTVTSKKVDWGKIPTKVLLAPMEIEILTHNEEGRLKQTPALAAQAEAHIRAAIPDEIAGANIDLVTPTNEQIETDPLFQKAYDFSYHSIVGTSGLHGGQYLHESVSEYPIDLTGFREKYDVNYVLLVSASQTTTSNRSLGGALKHVAKSLLLPNRPVTARYFSKRFAALVDTRTNEILWFNPAAKIYPSGPIYEKEHAIDITKKLFLEFPK